MKLPSGMTTAQLRAHIEGEIAKGIVESEVLVLPLDILALLVAMDLRERLDKDVEHCARFAKGIAEHQDDAYLTGQFLAGLAEAADRVLKHEPKPDMSGAPS